MQFRDRILRCAATGKEFVWTVAEQRERARSGLPLDPPLYCPDVRAADSRLGESYDKPSEVPSTPESDQPEESVPSAASSEQSQDRTARGRQPSKGGRSERPSSNGRRGGPRGQGRRRGPAPQTELRVRHTGTVKWFDEDRGYGFVAGEDGGELFLHASCLLVEDPGGLREGTPIEYEVERTDRGPQAVDVILLA